MNALRVSFLVVIDALMIAFLVSLLAGCVTMPSQYRNGDFVSHIAVREADVGTDVAIKRGAERILAENSAATDHRRTPG
jgi:hypothetical protein